LAECGYIGFYRWNHRRISSVGIPIGNSDGECIMSLYGDTDLNPSVIPSVKSSEKIPHYHTVFSFQNSIDSVGIYRRNNVVGNYYRQQRSIDYYRQQRSIGIDRQH
jgi:hypothetical protein